MSLRDRLHQEGRVVVPKRASQLLAFSGVVLGLALGIVIVYAPHYLDRLLGLGQVSYFDGPDARAEWGSLFYLLTTTAGFLLGAFTLYFIRYISKEPDNGGNGYSEPRPIPTPPSVRFLEKVH